MTAVTDVSVESDPVATPRVPILLHVRIVHRVRGTRKRPRANPKRTQRELWGFAPRLYWVLYRKNISPEKPDSFLLCQQARPGVKRKFSLPGIEPGT